MSNGLYSLMSPTHPAAPVRGPASATSTRQKNGSNNGKKKTQTNLMQVLFSLRLIMAFFSDKPFGSRPCWHFSPSSESLLVYPFPPPGIFRLFRCQAELRRAKVAELALGVLSRSHFHRWEAFQSHGESPGQKRLELVSLSTVAQIPRARRGKTTKKG